MQLWIWIGVGVFLFFGLFPTLVMASVIYSVLLVRQKPEKWDRSCSMPEDEEAVQMYREGLDWGEKYEENRRSLSIQSDGFRLCGEYFDFGFKKAVILIPGRTEACYYSYFFADVYRQAGYNVLAIDNRSHGLSEGRYAALGFKEYRDILAWGKELHDTAGVTSILLHGICIGASTALFALTARDCPDYFAGMVSEGMYTTFCSSFNNHMREDKHPVFPFSAEVMFLAWLFSGARPMTDGPAKRIHRLTKPILLLHSREDVFSLPADSAAMYERCTAPKRVVWFDKGAHSRIRTVDPTGYDDAIRSFLTDYGI